MFVYIQRDISWRLYDWVVLRDVIRKNGREIKENVRTVSDCVDGFSTLFCHWFI